MLRQGSKSGTQGPAKEGAVASGLDKVEKMIAWGRSLGFTQAATNLQNWRDGKGTLSIAAASLKSQSFILKHLKDVHRAKFIAGARRRLASGELAPGKPAKMTWTDSVNAPPMTDLFFALGGFTICSSVSVSVTPTRHLKDIASILSSPATSQKYLLQFDSWQFQVSDRYDWDPGKATLIPGIGRVTDDEMLALEQAGYGKPFDVTSEVVKVTDGEITAPIVIS